MSPPAVWVVATSNAGKVGEINAILGGREVELRSLDGYASFEFPPEGTDYAENAVVKAQTAARALGVTAVADDSGLEVEALGWGPGPLSARYGGDGIDDEGRVRKLLAALGGRPRSERRARFVCLAALATPDGEALCVRGECEGTIVDEPRGDAGFGYDPVFQLAGRELTMAELPAEEKNRVSHRARAFTALWEQWSGV